MVFSDRKRKKNLLFIEKFWIRTCIRKVSFFFYFYVLFVACNSQRRHDSGATQWLSLVHCSFKIEQHFLLILLMIYLVLCKTYK